jgi:hypothetical protein
MKTALKIIGGLFATLVLAIVIFYIGWMRPPSADKVCDNVEAITVAELASSGIDAPKSAVAEVRASCEKWAGTPPEFGRLPWVAKLKCSRDAKDAKALADCRK